MENFIIQAGNSLPKFPEWNAEIFNISCRKLCTPSFGAEMHNVSYIRQQTLCTKIPGWNAESVIFQTGNSVPQVSRLKCRQCQISGRKLYALSYWSEMRTISYFRQETMHPKFPGWKVENFVFQAGNSAPWVTSLKCGNCHIRHVTLQPKCR